MEDLRIYLIGELCEKLSATVHRDCGEVRTVVEGEQSSNSSYNNA